MKKAEQATCNYKLIDERRQKNWSQRDIADHIGTTVINVCRWERGITVPSRHFRGLLCQLFERSPEELGLFQQETRPVKRELPREYLVSPQQIAFYPSGLTNTIEAPSPHFWHVPYRRNLLFTGREEILAELSVSLDPENDAQRTLPQVICGPGGIGKTQLAIEYAYRQRSKYCAVLWINAETEERLHKDFTAIASRLGLLQTAADANATEQVLRWLSNNRNWLLIFDNIEDLAQVSNFLPPVVTGYVLFTTRRRITGTLGRRIDLESMGSQEGALFLLRRSKLLPPHTALTATPEQQEIAIKISRMMSGLPLALDQVGAYIEESASGLSDYILHYQTYRAALHNRRGTTVTDHPHSVTATYVSTMTQLEQRHPTAAYLAHLCAFLAPAVIPEEMIKHGLKKMGDEGKAMLAEPFIYEDAMNELYCCSLIQRHVETRMCMMSPLLQVILQETMDPLAQKKWAEITLFMVNRYLTDSITHRAEQLYQYCLPHVNACLPLIEKFGIVSADSVCLRHANADEPLFNLAGAMK